MIEDIVRLLLEAGANPNAPFQPRCDTALHVCPEFGDWPSILALLLDHPADMNVQDVEGTTALTVAVRQGCRSPSSFFSSEARMSKSRTRRRAAAPVSIELLVLAPHSTSAYLRRVALTSIVGTRMTSAVNAIIGGPSRHCPAATPTWMPWSVMGAVHCFTRC